MGGVKIHISKNKPFDLQKSKIVASTISTFLKSEIADNETKVLPELCFCIDVFSERITSANQTDESTLIEITETCKEIKQAWNVT